MILSLLEQFALTEYLLGLHAGWKQQNLEQVLRDFEINSRSTNFGNFAYACCVDK